MVGIQYLDIDMLLTFQVCLFTVEPVKNSHICSVFIQSTGSLLSARRIPVLGFKMGREGR